MRRSLAAAASVALALGLTGCGAAPAQGGSDGGDVPWWLLLLHGASSNHTTIIQQPATAPQSVPNTPYRPSTQRDPAKPATPPQSSAGGLSLNKTPTTTGGRR